MCIIVVLWLSVALLSPVASGVLTGTTDSDCAIPTTTYYYLLPTTTYYLLPATTTTTTTTKK